MTHPPADETARMDCGCRPNLHPGLSHDEYMDIYVWVANERFATEIQQSASWVSVASDQLIRRELVRLERTQKAMAAGHIRDANTLSESERRRYQQAIEMTVERLRKAQP